MRKLIQTSQPQTLLFTEVKPISSPVDSLVSHSQQQENKRVIIGYQVQPYIIPASAIGAEHERKRVFLVAHAERFRQPRSGALLGPMQPTPIANRETNRFINHVFREAMPYMCKHHDGIPGKLAEGCLTIAGNAIVPQLAYQILKTIQDYENIVQ